MKQLIHPIRLPTPFAVGDVYSYLITDEKIILVDCGPKTGDSLGYIRTALKERNLGVTDLDEIWLTHGHPDHFGQAAVLADLSGAIVYGHKKERANYGGNNDGELFEEFFDEQQIPHDHIVFMLKQLEWLQQFQEPVCPEWINVGEVLTSGSLSFTVHHTPGHSPGHLAFCSGNGSVFSGDVLLEHISTNALINFDPVSGVRNKSLLQYRESLQWIRKLEGTVWPGHGKIILTISGLLPIII